MKKGTISLVSTLIGAAAGAGATGFNASQKLREKQMLADKHFVLYQLMNQWVKVKQENKSIAGYLEGLGYKEIAIYGMNYVGETLFNELAGSSIKVKYAIDKNADNLFSEVDIISPEDDLEAVDAIIVTPVTFFDEIEEKLAQKTDCPIISIEDILYEI